VLLHLVCLHQYINPFLTFSLLNSSAKSYQISDLKMKWKKASKLCVYLFSLQLSDDSWSLPGESPYIGKGLFHKSEHAVGHRSHAKPGEVRHGTLNDSTRTPVVSSHCAEMSRGQLDYTDVDRNVISTDEQRQIDSELQDKIHTLAEGRLWFSVRI